MRDWLEPSLLATLTATFIMTTSYGYLYFSERQDSLKYFSLAWLVYSVRFLLDIIGLHFHLPAFLCSLRYLSNLLNCGLLLIGVFCIFGKSVGRLAFWFSLISVIISVMLQISGLDFFRKTTLVYILTGSVYIYTGVLFLKLKNRNMIYFILGIDFILWGIHKYDFPFLYSSEVFAPFGYLFAALFSLIAAQGILILYYRVTKTAFQRDEERLSSLVDIINIADAGKLLEKALAIALHITESVCGCIFRYSEEEEKLMLSAWSESVNPGCRVGESFTACKLSDSGYWGDAVRMKAPVIFNDAPAGSAGVKGLPEGYVKIDKFLSVPLVSDGRILAVISVANKPEDYNDSDVRQLTLLMNSVWKIVEIREYQKKLEKAKKRAEENNSLKSAFLANISHELRTPLNGTLGMLSLIKSGELPPELSVFVNMAYRSAEDMLYLVEDILSFAQTSNRKQVSEITEFDLLEDIGRMVELQRITAAAKGLGIELRSSFSEYRVATDRIKFNQIVVNLISNAVKFSEHGIIEVSVFRKDKLTVMVKDEGIGIPKNKFDLIFEPFYQLEDPYTKTHKGIGAGLAIVKSLCELLDIDIAFESEEGVGTAFFLTLGDAGVSPQ